jgi:uncharacterized membrane protein
MNWIRLVRHFLVSLRGTRTLFDPSTMLRLQEAIARGEATHRGEVRLIIESALPARKIRRGMTPTQRALDLFGTFRAWDTEENNGVLLYLNVADRKIEVIADRAASKLVGDQHWLFACGLAQEAFKHGEFERGLVSAIDAIHRGLALAFPVKSQVGRPPRPDSVVTL